MGARLDFAHRTRSVPVRAGGRSIAVSVLTLRTGVVWEGAAKVSGGLGLSVPVAVRTPEDTRRVPFSPSRPAQWIAGTLLARPSRAAIDEWEDTVAEKDEMDFVPRVPAEEVSRALATAASGAGAVGPATTAGDRVVIPLIETMFSGGFGGGGGRGPSEQEGRGGGGGGGGAGRTRTVAVAEVGPEGVRIHPVIDRTALGLAALATVAGILGSRLFRRRR